MTRRRFSEKDVLLTMLLQGAIIPCGRCRIAIIREDLAEVERDHFLPLALGGGDTPQNCSYLHGACHKEKTNGRPATTYGSDKGNIAKARRLSKGGRKRRGAAIPSRAFANSKDGPFKTKMSGTTERRT